MPGLASDGRQPSTLCRTRTKQRHNLSILGDGLRFDVRQALPQHVPGFPVMGSQPLPLQVAFLYLDLLKRL